MVGNNPHDSVRLVMRAIGGDAFGVCSADAGRLWRIQKDRVRLGIYRRTAAPEPEGLTRSSITL